MRIDRPWPGATFYVAESAADFEGWEILWCELFKPDIYKLQMRRRTDTGAEAIICFSKVTIP